MNSINKECSAISASAEQQQCYANIALAFEQAVVDTLLIKCRRALTETGLTRLVVAGGVSANLRLRTTLEAYMASQSGQVYFPRPLFCTDNGAMIAYAGCLRLLAGESKNLAFSTRARWPMAELTAI